MLHSYIIFIKKIITAKKNCGSKKTSRKTAAGVIPLVRLSGIEPPHMASEATALSTELQAHIKGSASKMLYPTNNIISKTLEICKRLCYNLYRIFSEQ